MPANTEALTQFEASGGVLRTSQALKRGIHRSTLYRLRDTGQLDVVSRGVYALPGFVARPAAVTAALRVPRGVFCLISALDIFEIGTQVAHEVQLAVPHGTKVPRLGEHPVQLFRWSGASLTEGIVSKDVDGVPVRVYCPAKTVVDCFRARYKIGINVAVEALRDVLERRICQPYELDEFAAQGRVANVMRPYLEALIR